MQDPQANEASMRVHVDFDKIIREVLTDLCKAVEGWASGAPKDETALLNRLTEKLNRDRRHCDVGVESPVTMTSELFELHRRGEHSRDEYGSDLAVTIRLFRGWSGPPILTKTALFQLKIGSGPRVSLDSQQVHLANWLPETAKRAFVLALDKDRSAFRVESIGPFIESFGTSKEKSFPTVDWPCLSEWLTGWFMCSVGPQSDSSSSDSVEKLLERFKLPIQPSKSVTRADEKLPPYYVPARCWLAVDFRQRG